MTTLPPLLRAGFAVLVAGAVVDLAYHVLGVGGAAGALAGHLVSLAGMVVVMAGVFTTAARARSRRPSRRSTP